MVERDAPLPRLCRKCNMGGIVKRVTAVVLLLVVVGGGCARMVRPTAGRGRFCDAGWFTGTGPDADVAHGAVVKAFSAEGMEWGRELRLYGSHGASVSVPCARATEARRILQDLEDEGIIRFEPMRLPAAPMLESR